jgi:hypothetical protein
MPWLLLINDNEEIGDRQKPEKLENVFDDDDDQFLLLETEGL